MSVYKPVSNISGRDRKKRSIFLAGSIDLGKAIEWQREVEKQLDIKQWNIFNPRRDNMDPNMIQSFDNPEFYHQVLWELDGLAQADVILMFFDPTAKSPISLLELGLFASSGKLRVVCPPGFWRKGNVDIVCQRYNIPLYEDIDLALKDISVLKFDKHKQYKCQFKGDKKEECWKVLGRCVICDWYE